RGELGPYVDSSPHIARLMQAQCVWRPYRPPSMRALVVCQPWVDGPLRSGPCRPGPARHGPALSSTRQITLDELLVRRGWRIEDGRWRTTAARLVRHPLSSILHRRFELTSPVPPCRARLPRGRTADP